MAASQSFPLEAVRTDGWFERIGEGIGSFQALCEIIGERFFAFSMITGAHITAVTVDRRNPENTLVDFSVGSGADEEPQGESQRLSLGDFRRRLVGALLGEEAPAPIPERDTDLEGVQLHIGVRYLLLAPLYGYSLKQLNVTERFSELVVLHDGIEEKHELEGFRSRIRAHVREELERVASGHRGAIDLSRVAEAEAASLAGDDPKVIQLLGAWPAPLAIFLRTPEGQLLSAEPRALIAKALGLLGTSCVRLGDVLQGEEIFRLGVQYAQDGIAAGDIFTRLGLALYDDQRPGEAIAPLRRAITLGGDAKVLWPMLGRAFAKRSRFIAAFACYRQALAAGVPDADLLDDMRQVELALGPKLTAWRAALVGASD
jgi:tetratricopeptide (TPR) repeat protein